MQTDSVVFRRRRYGDRVPPRVLCAHVVLGSLQVCLGGLAVLASCVGFVIGQGYSKSLAAFMFGPIFVLAGLLGILAGKRVGRTLALVVSCLVLSVIASCLAFIAIYMEAMAAVQNRWLNLGPPSNGTEPGPEFPDPPSHPADPAGSAAYPSVMFSSAACGLLFLLEFVLAIVHAAFACRASCCCVPARSAAEDLQLVEPMQEKLAAAAGEPIQVAFYPGQLAAFFRCQQVAFYPGQQVHAAGGFVQPPSYDSVTKN